MGGSKGIYGNYIGVCNHYLSSNLGGVGGSFGYLGRQWPGIRTRINCAGPQG